MEIAWYYMAILLQGGIGLVIYARWRAAQQSMRLVQANETQRARTAQRLQSARLLALQARVDPQLLFDCARPGRRPAANATRRRPKRC